MEALLNTPVAMPCLASQQKPRAAAPAANLSGLRRSSIKGFQVACRRPSLAKQRLVAPVRAAAAVVEETKVDEKTAMLAINAIRFLSIDGVNKANSGHPGLPMGCAPMGYVLYNEYMQHNPKHPKWFNRDRFVLSAGHGCMLQYSLMHLTGYDSVSVSHSRCLLHNRLCVVTLGLTFVGVPQMDDCKQFRQWESKTPGHPENFETEGIEVTTGAVSSRFLLRGDNLQPLCLRTSCSRRSPGSGHRQRRWSCCVRGTLGSPIQQGRAQDSRPLHVRGCVVISFGHERPFSPKCYGASIWYCCI